MIDEEAMDLIEIFRKEIDKLRYAGDAMEKALRYGGERQRALALMHYELTRRGEHVV